MAALDCEMIYTTGGMRVARVSVVDGNGKEVFDEFVRMDEGVQVLDYNTRFSGITSELYSSRAKLTLSSIRKSLDNLIDQDTILIGHALDNDLKTLRMVHTRCVDTCLLFPHPAGAPYRRSLRDLARDHLSLKIQTGDGSTGHSSVEDAVATLDLVKFYVMNKGNIPGLATSSASAASKTANSRVGSTSTIPSVMSISPPNTIRGTSTPIPVPRRTGMVGGPGGGGVTGIAGYATRSPMSASPAMGSPRTPNSGSPMMGARPAGSTPSITRVGSPPGLGMTTVSGSTPSYRTGSPPGLGTTPRGTGRVGSPSSASASTTASGSGSTSTASSRSPPKKVPVYVG